MKKTLSLILALCMLIALAACGKTDASSLWDGAAYTQDALVGSGNKSVQLEVKAGDKSVTLTIKTDREMLGDALTDNDLVLAEDGSYGMYIKSVIGITADYDTDGAYWALSKNGEYLMTGADTTPIENEEHYELTYTK